VPREEKFSAGEPIAARPELGNWQPQPAPETPIRRVQGYKKVLPQGATDTEGSGIFSRRLVRTLGGVFFLAMLCTGGYFAAEPVMNLLERPLSQVTVEGEFRYVGKQRTMDLISAELNSDFLQLDLMKLKAVLESDPWVEYAALGRQWPDTLLVKIIEQKPIARWGDTGFMNQRGEIIHVDNTDALTDLPRLDGDETDANRIMQQYQDLSQLLRSRGLEIVTLSGDKKKSWRVTLKGNIDLVIGRDQVMEKMRRFITVYDKHLSSLWPDVKAVDVRYTNGIAVQWLPESEASKQFIKPSLIK
jgi:cell division protein FtsQ